jgi:hypothetical protein
MARVLGKCVRDEHVLSVEKAVQYSEGITDVVVNGRVVLAGGKMAEERPGKPLSPLRR